MASINNLVPQPLRLRCPNRNSMNRNFFPDASKASVFRRSSNHHNNSSDASTTFTSPPTRRPDRPGMNAFTTPSNEPPPAYSASTPTGHTTQPTTTAPTTPVATVSVRDDDPYAFLTKFDVKFLIDDSGSMSGALWEQAKAAISIITPICTAYDADGIDIHFLNKPDQPNYANVKTAAAVEDVFKGWGPKGRTPMGERLDAILRPYLRRLENAPVAPKPLNLIVITDGEPNDDPESVLINAAKKLDKLDALPWQVGVQFFQIGQDPEATGFLAGLDDDLTARGNGCRDIVDTVPYDGSGPLSGETILKVVLGAVNRRIDRRKNA